LIVLGGRAQNAWILGQIRLGKSRHDAARAGTGNSQAYGIAEGECVADPAILDEVFHAADIEHDVWPEASDLEAPLGVKLAESVNGIGGQQVHRGRVEDGARRQVEVADRIALVE